MTITQQALWTIYGMVASGMCDIPTAWQWWRDESKYQSVYEDWWTSRPFDALQAAAALLNAGGTRSKDERVAFLACNLAEQWGL